MSCTGTDSVGPESMDGSNVVVIVIDTLRADHLATYGYPKSTAPFIERLAGSSVVFDAAYATSTWTAPSTASLFTSLYPKDHGLKSGMWISENLGPDGTELNRIPPEAETLPEFMQSLGYRTFGFADNPNITDVMGFASGFDYFFPGVDRGSPAIAEEVLALKDEIIGSNRPSFLYLHLMDPHKPYVQRDPYFQLEGTLTEGTKYADVAKYDSEIGLVDEVLAQLSEALDWDSNTLVLLTSDHGEEFGDHGNSGHGTQLYNELLHVPLIVHGTDATGAPVFEASRVGQSVCLIDLLPTIRTLLGQPASDHDGGRDLSELLEDPSATFDRVIFPERLLEFSRKPFSLQAAIDDGFKLYTSSNTPRPMLFDLTVDPDELQDVSQAHADRVQRLEQAIEQHIDEPAKFERSFAPPMDIDAAAVESLRALGYAGD
jgi:arylsulfatase A-like enzyme